MTDPSPTPRRVVSRKARLSKGLVVVMTIDSDGRLSCAWDPGAPGSLTAVEMARFQKHRDQLVANFVRRTGGHVAVVEE